MITIATILTFINIIKIIIGILFIPLFLRPFWLKFYYRYIDKSDVKIKINGKNYIIKGDTKECVVDQMERQDKE